MSRAANWIWSRFFPGPCPAGAGVDNLWGELGKNDPTVQNLTGIATAYGEARTKQLQRINRTEEQLAAVYHVLPKQGVARRRAFAAMVERWESLGILTGDTCVIDVGAGTGNLLAAFQQRASDPNAGSWRLTYVPIEKSEAFLSLLNEVARDARKAMGSRFGGHETPYVAADAGALPKRWRRSLPDAERYIVHFGGFHQKINEHIPTDAPGQEPAAEQQHIKLTHGIVGLVPPRAAVAVSVFVNQPRSCGTFAGMLDRIAALHERATHFLIYPCPSSSNANRSRGCWQEGTARECGRSSEQGPPPREGPFCELAPGSSGEREFEFVLVVEGIRGRFSGLCPPSCYPSSRSFCRP